MKKLQTTRTKCPYNNLILFNCYFNRNIVEAAKMAIKNKVRQKEPMHKFIDKKREMFLFQMLIDHKREQINQFEELTRLQERGLQKVDENFFKLLNF